MVHLGLPVVDLCHLGKLLGAGANGLFSHADVPAEDPVFRARETRLAIGKNAGSRCHRHENKLGVRRRQLVEASKSSSRVHRVIPINADAERLLIDLGIDIGY